MSNRVKRFVPIVYSNNDELQDLYGVESEEIDRLHSNKNEIFKNNFILTAGIKGIKQYEDLYGIETNVDYTSEERRENIKNKMLWKPPFTRQRLIEILENIWGEGNYNFQIDYEHYALTIDVYTTSPIVFFQFQQNIKNVIPANMYIIFAVQYTYLYLMRNYTYNRLEDLTYGDLSQYAED